MERDGEFRQLVADVQACRACSRMANSERILGAGSGRTQSPIMFIGEAPGRLGADESAIPFHGDKAGDNFERLINQVGLTRYDIFITNAVLCNPRDDDGNNATPVSNEIHNCSHFLVRQIELVRPRLVVTLGAKALQALSLIEPHQIQLSAAMRKVWVWRGMKLVPLYHPGQRAMIHRSFSNQLGDYQFVAETWRRMNESRRGTKTATKQPVADIARSILSAAHRLSYFALHKIFYLVEYEHVRRTGARLSSAYIVRQKDGPYVTDLHLLRLKSALPNLVISRQDGMQYLELIDRQAGLFEEPTNAAQGPDFIAALTTSLSRLSNADLKRKVYLTLPMRQILKREAAGEPMYNAPLDFVAAPAPDRANLKAVAR
jgi:uracil-DNA glycosylase family 4